MHHISNWWSNEIVRSQMETLLSYMLPYLQYVKRLNLSTQRVLHFWKITVKISVYRSSIKRICSFVKVQTRTLL